MSYDADFDLQTFLATNERGFSSHAQHGDRVMNTEEELRYQRLAWLVDNIKTDARGFVTRLAGAYSDV